MTIAGDVITATITDATLGNSTGAIKRALYSATSKVPADLLNVIVAPATTASKGLYTLGFPSKAQTGSPSLSSYPQGDGFGSITLSDVGVVGLAGTLADGTAITVSSILVAGNECPIFVQLATPGSTTLKGASFGGVLTFDATQADSDVSGVDFRWFRPAVVAPATANAVMDLYTAGWPEGIKVDAVGALYDATKTLQQSLGITETAAANTDLLFDNLRYRVSTTGGSTYNYGIKSVAVNTIKVVGNVISGLTTASAATLTTVQTTGAFSGTVKADVTAPTSTPAYKGIIVQKGANQGGYGYVISNTAGDRDQESGGVSLTAK